MGFTFKKEERLCSRQLIDRLYAEGHRLMAFPYSVQWMPLESGERRAENGERRTESGEWRTENGEWRAENGEWRTESGDPLSHSATQRLSHTETQPLRDSATQPLSHSACQVMIVAPKRKFRHAVDRNRVRRLTRECYRLRKHALYDFLRQNGLSLVFSMVYIHNEMMSYEQLGHKMDKLLAALQKDILAHQQPSL